MKYFTSVYNIKTFAFNHSEENIKHINGPVISEAITIYNLLDIDILYLKYLGNFITDIVVFLDNK